MAALFSPIMLVCLFSLLVPPAFVYLGAIELAFAASGIGAVVWFVMLATEWIDSGRPSPWLILSGCAVLFWPPLLLMQLLSCGLAYGCW